MTTEIKGNQSEECRPKYEKIMQQLSTKQSKGFL